MGSRPQCVNNKGVVSSILGHRCLPRDDAYFPFAGFRGVILRNDFAEGLKNHSTRRISLQMSSDAKLKLKHFDTGTNAAKGLVLVVFLVCRQHRA